jgi:uncharacterized protein (TIGR00725 family)
LSTPVSTRVAVVGPGDAAEGSPEWATAETAGRLLAEAGLTVVCGGLWGVMAAVCRGASAAGGHTVGVLPGHDPTTANPWVQEAMPTGLGEGRNALVVRNADVVIAIGGGYGTLSEIALALRAGTAVIGIGTWELRMPGRDPAPIVRVETPEAAVTAALNYTSRT